MKEKLCNKRRAKYQKEFEIIKKNMSKRRRGGVKTEKENKRRRGQQMEEKRVAFFVTMKSQVISLIPNEKKDLQNSE